MVMMGNEIDSLHFLFGETVIGGATSSGAPDSSIAHLWLM